MLTALAMPLLLTAAAAAGDVPPEPGAFSWCVATATGPNGGVRYLSDPFESDRDEGDAQAFREYVEQAYPHAGNARYISTCTHFPGRAAADAALAQARAGGGKIVATAWRARFE